jgi:rhomboid protease GluP
MFESSLEPSPMHSQVAAEIAAGAPPEPPATFLLRLTRDPRRIEAWALVLTSKGVPSLIRPRAQEHPLTAHYLDGVLELHVPFALRSFAQAELQAADEEEHEARRATIADAALVQPAATRHPLLGAALLAVVLLAFFFVTGPRTGGSAWFSAGASDAERVVAGEWWRAVTALTLHADSAHVLSNVGLGTLAIGAVMRSEGIGWGAALVVASGTAGNLINAWVHQSMHRSVGFSTAVFGAIGILGGLAYVHGRRHVRAPRPAWTALAGSVALLALLGTSEKTSVDMLAHLFGGVAGIGLGLLVAWTRWRPTTTAGQYAAGFGVIASVAGAWLAALR